jgi:DNA mismatch repair protein MutS2
MSFGSTEILEFGELQRSLARYAGSAAGRALVLSLAPHSDREELETALAEADDAIAYLREAQKSEAVRLRFDQIRDMEPHVRALQVEGIALEGREILELFHTLSLAGEYRALLLAVAARHPRLAQHARSLADLRDLARRYARVFLPDGSLSDDASVALGRIRRDITRQKKSIQESLELFLRAHRSDRTLQEDFVTIREDRYVVPIVAGQKGRVDGVIHGSSGTGRTLFLEPLETIGLNNQLVRLREDELREIERILAEITEALRAHAPEIAASVETLAAFDFVFAKAAFALDYDAIVPRFGKRLLLREARHPLLEAVLRNQHKPIVPLTFELNESQPCLLISGPNTGGKTVTLKTAGLLALMAHAALPVPCVEAEFPLLSDVLADIGDQQSIAESLSSFSGHLLHVKEMLARVTPDSLVLLDELGRATDPEEGGALGVAMLDEFRKAGAFCLASTHLLPLKLYGARTAGVLNASMGFDDATLAPTYELRLGAPGKSAGLDIATRLEMPAALLAHARQVLPRQQADFQELLAELHRQVDDNARRTQELTTRQTELEAEAARREKQREREWEKRSESLIADFEARAQKLLTPRQITQAAQEFREKAAEVIAPRAAPKHLTLVEGARVRLKGVREIAVLRRLLKNGLIEVEAGSLKMQIPREDVVDVILEPAPPKKARVETGPHFEVLTSELNVIGQRAEEAVAQVDKFLDTAVLSSAQRVRIVHGHGMGVLKRAIGEALGSNPHVGRFYPATQAEGGAGATIVELRE